MKFVSDLLRSSKSGGSGLRAVVPAAGDSEKGVVGLFRRSLLLHMTVFGVLCCVVTVASADDKPQKPTSDQDGWQPLFNGKDLTGWKVTEFGGEGEVTVAEGIVTIDQGVDLSGITSTRKDLPRMNYEIEFEARRVAGSDFFAGLTFPVHDSACSLIVGGWGGGVTGISSLDGLDASENETTGFFSFTKEQWYKFRLRVTPGKIEAWMDEKSLVDVETEGRKIDVRFEVELSKPLGFSTYQTTAEIRGARIRPIAQQSPKSPSKASDASQ
ncbi:MAG: DUF1080 domain-containing protein [Planctomycetaceae bacterium]|nr:DUF1080 domain-containing protein [Planctomycetaceae bacterium]